MIIIIIIMLSIFHPQSFDRSNIPVIEIEFQAFLYN